MRHTFALLAALVGLLVLAPAADAAETHPFRAETNGAPTGARRPPTGAFEDACGIALGPGGDRYYVADYYHDAVDILGPGGEYLTQIAEESDGNGPCGLAVDGEGHLYVQNWRAEVIRYTPSAYPPTAATTYGERTVIDPSGTATGLAVDPATGDLFVDDGTYVAQFEAPVHGAETPARIGEGQIGEGYGLARSSFPATAGDLYVPDAAAGVVRVFGPAGEALPAIDGAGTPQAGFERLVDSAVAVDPTDGHVFVADNTEHGLTEHPVVAIDEFNPAGAYRGQISRWITHPASEPGVIVEHALQDAEPSGLAIDPAGDVLVTSGNSDNSEATQLDKEGRPIEGSVLYTFGPTAPAKVLTVTRSGAGVGTVTSAPAGIACGSACTAEYDEGAKVTLTATPDPHSTFGGWSGEGCAGTSSTCLVTMSQARTVGAEFAAIPQQPLEVSVVGSGSGTVASSPAGISCDVGTCTEHFNEGSTVTLTEHPVPHSRFAGWGGVQCDESTATTCDVQMTAAEAVAAQFAPIPQQPLTVQTSGEGTLTSVPAGIECGKTCTEHFDEGTTVTLTAAPATHDQVTWSGCDAEPSLDECTVTVNAAKSISAAFAPVHHGLVVSVVGAGSVSADHGAVSGCSAGAGSCAGAYEEGEAIILVASPAAGSTFAGWSGACGGTGPCSLTIDADAAVTANFTAIPPAPVPARLSLGKLTVKGPVASLDMIVSGPGTVSAAGSGLKSATATVAAAGAVTLPLALDAAGRRTLSRRGKLRVVVTLTFTSSAGPPAAIASKAVVFEAGQKRHSKRKHHPKQRRH